VTVDSASQVAVVRPEGTVTHRSVLLGDESGETVELRSALRAGDRVIVAGGYALPEDVKVEVEK